MGQLNIQSILKAALVGGIVNVMIAAVSGANALLPAGLANLLWITLCCGAVLVPIGSGLLYGYFTPGREGMGQAALGGGIVGLVVGIIFGLVNSAITVAVGVVNGVPFEAIIANSTTALTFGCCGALVFGLLLGALGGVGWSLLPGNQ